MEGFDSTFEGGLQRTADRLKCAGGLSWSSWPAQADHPRLCVADAEEGVDGGPSAAMTMKAPVNPSQPACGLLWRNAA
jgi:hypothetical protein